VSAKDGLFKVEYADGDAEDFERDELEALLSQPAAMPTEMLPTRVQPRRQRRLEPLPTVLKSIFFSAPRINKASKKLAITQIPSSAALGCGGAVSSSGGGDDADCSGGEVSADSTAPGLSCRGRTIRRVHSNPHVFEIDHFLTEPELQHLDLIVAQQDRLSSQPPRSAEQQQQKPQQNQAQPQQQQQQQRKRQKRPQEEEEEEEEEEATKIALLLLEKMLLSKY